jgi:hypothetical protein
MAIRPNIFSLNNNIDDGMGTNFSDRTNLGGFINPRTGMTIGGGGGGGVFNTPFPIRTNPVVTPIRTNPTPIRNPFNPFVPPVRTNPTLTPVREPMPELLADTPIMVQQPAVDIVQTIQGPAIVPPPPKEITVAQINSEVAAQATSLANDIVKDLISQTKPSEGGRIFTRFEPINDVVENQKVFLTTGLFSNTTNGVSINAATMSVMYTGSIQSAASKQYYYEVWNKNIGTAEDAEPQFSIAYGHRRGSGSSAAGTLNDSPSRAVYSQYRLLLLNPEDTQFTFKDGTSTDSIYVINFNRARILEKVDPGNWQLTLGQLAGASYANSSHTGSNVRLAAGPGVISLIDDSGDTQENRVATVGRVVNVVSGSILNGIHNPTNPHYYGLVYPDMGMIVLNDTKLCQSASFNTVTGSNINGDNAWKLYTSISGAFTIDPLNYSFQSRNSIVRTSAHYFVRIKNAEYNFSNNPTYVTGSEGEFSQPTFLGDPTVYITTVGMYNDRQELLAVGKLSKPIQKSFSKESLIKVRLDF